MAPDQALERASDDVPSWLDVMEEVLDSNIGEDEEIAATFEDLTVDVPASLGEGTDHYSWRFDGSVTVRTEGMRATLVEWLRYWDDGPD
ncbi:hypothetical protein [Halomarina litorea]|uniref:hypothetical protein n=1 Tax=Halomarina litorea TaxID=2961595 RepID=UPI0020C28336|nr:hypothetical protein [Halomarina sp. BCD28]